MKKLIHNYLSKCFFIDGNDIYRLKQKRTLSSTALVEELSEVFGMTKKQLKWYVKSWVLRESKSFPFNRYWTPPKSKFSFFFPLAKKIAAQTIDMDLVSVQPLGAPSGQLMYFDYQINSELEQGYVFAPYIAIETTPVLVDAFNPSSGITSRYSRREINSNYFQQINLVD